MYVDFCSQMIEAIVNLSHFYSVQAFTLARSLSRFQFLGIIIDDQIESLASALDLLLM